MQSIGKLKIKKAQRRINITGRHCVVKISHSVANGNCCVAQPNHSVVKTNGFGYKIGMEEL